MCDMNGKQRQEYLKVLCYWFRQWGKGYMSQWCLDVGKDEETEFSLNLLGMKIAWQSSWI